MTAIRRLAALAAGALCLASCSGTGARSSPSAGRADLSAADALFFSSRYPAAEKAYTAAVHSHPDDPRALAALALFHNYQLDFAAATGEADRAVKLGPQDGHVLAIRCKVEDWSTHIDAAVATGRQAVSLAPADPLAHLFLSEALADHGDTAMARQEIARGRALITPAASGYVRAELPREEANLAHDLGDAPGRIGSLVAARDAQPRWVDRSAELINAYLDAGDTAGAGAAIDAALAVAPDDPKVIQDLGRSALPAADYAAAKSLWARALALSPRDPHVLDVNAQVAVAVDHDLSSAEHLFEQALSVDPSDAVAAGYLLALARYARGDEALGRQEISAATPKSYRPGPLDPDLKQAADAQAALTAVNATRTTLGLKPVTLDPKLNQSAIAHSYYWLFNNASPTVLKLGIHRETPGLLGYRGVDQGTRAISAGYTGQRVGEDITHQGADFSTDPTRAVSDWVDSVYHRFPIVRPDLTVIGYGEAAMGPIPIQDMEFGFDPPSAAPPIVYPAPDQTGIPTSFSDNEIPDPLPAGAPRVSGYPVTVTFRAGAVVSNAALTLAGPSGPPLDGYLIPPGSDDENSIALLAKAALSAHTRYTAQVVATVDGAHFERTWSFTTT